MLPRLSFRVVLTLSRQRQHWYNHYHNSIRIFEHEDYVFYIRLSFNTKCFSSKQVLVTATEIGKRQRYYVENNSPNLYKCFQISPREKISFIYSIRKSAHPFLITLQDCTNAIFRLIYSCFPHCQIIINRLISTLNTCRAKKTRRNFSS